jgi:hypothetical protein
MFDMDLTDFDVKKNITRLQKIKFRLFSKIVFGLSPQICIFFKTLFFLTSVLRRYYGKTFFFKSKMAACIEMAFFSFWNHPIFKKSSPSNEKFKNKNFNEFTKDVYSKELINRSLSKNIHYGAENQDGCEFRVFVNILLLQHGLCLNL